MTKQNLIVVITHKDQALISPEEVRSKLKFDKLEVNMVEIFEVDATNVEDGRMLLEEIEKNINQLETHE